MQQFKIAKTIAILPNMKANMNTSENNNILRMKDIESLRKSSRLLRYKESRIISLKEKILKYKRFEYCYLINLSFWLDMDTTLL